MKRYKRELKESGFPGSNHYQEQISNIIVEMFNSDYSGDNNDYETLENIAEIIGDAIDDCIYDMVGPDRKKGSAFKAYIKKYIGN